MIAAADGNRAIVPVFILDPDVHLRFGPSRLALLHAALASLRDELRNLYSIPLVLRRGDPATELPKLAGECGAARCYTVEADVEEPIRQAQVKLLLSSCYK